jgi:tetratricopeptide (TPR) repeat protein
MAPEAGWIYSNLGRTYVAMEDKVKAAEVFWKALELLPGDHYVMEQLIALGEMFIIPHENEKGEAQAAFVKRADYEKKMTEAVEKAEEPETLAKFGWKLLHDHLNDLACRCFEKLLKKKDEPQALLGLGIAHLESGRAREAERFLLEYLDQNPNSSTAHLNLFKVYLSIGETDLAWDEIQTAVRLDPDRPEALKQLFYLYLQTDRKEEGMEWMDRLSLENPTSFAPLLVKAGVLAEAQQWPEARKALEEALRRSPHNEEILLFMTSEMGKRGEREELIRVIQGEPGPLPLSLTINLALAYSQTGRLEEGRKALQAFLDRPGQNALDRERAKVILKEFEKE